MKRWFILIVLLFNILASTAYAGSMSFPLSGELVVTSPFGWRVHPIFRTQIFHSGIDFAANYGQTVYASAGGIVNYSGWISGYGNVIILDHGNGVQTLYGHNERLLTFPGDNVNQGAVIAYAGSTGNSTGPHVHFEVMLNGQPVDPAGYLNGSLPVSDGSFMDFFKSDYNFIPLNFDASIDFAKPMRNTATSFAKACTAGLDILKDKINWLFIALITMDFALAAFWTFFFKEDVPFAHWLISRLLFYCFLIFMLQHWGDWVANVVLDLFTTMGGAAAGATAAEAGKVVSDPTLIVQKGVSLVGPVFTYIGSLSGPELLLNLQLIVIALVLTFAILACFALIGIQILLSYIEFYMIALFSFVMFSFSGLRYVRHYGGNGLNALIAVAVKLMFFCIFSVLLTNILQNLTVEDYFIKGGINLPLLFTMLLLTALFMLFASRVSATTMSLFGSSGFQFDRSDDT